MWTRKDDGHHHGRPDGPWIGPSKSVALDMMMVPTFFGGAFHLDSDKVRVDQCITQPGDQMSYVYDLGDYWHHTIVVERVEADIPAFDVLDGLGAGPPEDVGGPVKYTEYIN